MGSMGLGSPVGPGGCCAKAVVVRSVRRGGELWDAHGCNGDGEGAVGIRL